VLLQINKKKCVVGFTILLDDHALLFIVARFFKSRSENLLKSLLCL